MSLEDIHTPTKKNTSGLILAGGRGQRFNNKDKGLIPFKGTTLVEHAINKLTPQVNSVLISANRNLDFYQELSVTCIQDIFSTYPGPLAGIHAALQKLETDWLVSIACDTPCFPNDYVERLSVAVSQSKSLVAIAQSNNRLQNVFMLVHKTLFNSLDSFLNKGERKAQIWLEQHKPTIVNFNPPSNNTADPFYNINSPDDLGLLERTPCYE